MERTPPDRRTWLIIVFAMFIAPLIYGSVGSWIPASGSMLPAAELERLQPLFMAGALAGPFLGMVVAHFGLRMRSAAPDSSGAAATLPAPEQFQRSSVVALALAESSSVIGFLQFFLGPFTWRDFVPFGLTTVLAILIGVLPAGLRYWNAYEASTATTGTAR